MIQNGSMRTAGCASKPGRRLERDVLCRCQQAAGPDAVVIKEAQTRQSMFTEVRHLISRSTNTYDSNGFSRFAVTMVVSRGVGVNREFFFETTAQAELPPDGAR
jgi:hypothetical protein